MGICLACGAPQAQQRPLDAGTALARGRPERARRVEGRLCSSCGTQVLRGLDIFMQRSSHLSKALRPDQSPNTQASFRIFLGMLSFSRYLFFILAFCAFAALWDILPIWKRATLRAQLSVTMSSATLGVIVFCAGVLGFQLGRRFWRSLVRWYPTLVDKPPASYGAMLLSYWRALSRNVIYFGLSTGGLLAVGYVIAISVSCRSVWGSTALLSVLGLFAITVGMLMGLCLGIFYYGDWVASCRAQIDRAGA